MEETSRSAPSAGVSPGRRACAERGTAPASARFKIVIQAFTAVCVEVAAAYPDGKGPQTLQSLLELSRLLQEAEDLHRTLTIGDRERFGPDYSYNMSVEKDSRLASRADPEVNTAWALGTGTFGRHLGHKAVTWQLRTLHTPMMVWYLGVISAEDAERLKQQQQQGREVDAYRVSSFCGWDSDCSTYRSSHIRHQNTADRQGSFGLFEEDVSKVARRWVPPDPDIWGGGSRELEQYRAETLSFQLRLDFETHTLTLRPDAAADGDRTRSGGQDTEGDMKAVSTQQRELVLEGVGVVQTGESEVAFRLCADVMNSQEMVRVEGCTVEFLE